MLTILENVASGFKSLVVLLSPLDIVGMFVVFTAICFFQSFFASKKLC